MEGGLERLKLHSRRHTVPFEGSDFPEARAWIYFRAWLEDGRKARNEGETVPEEKF